MTDDDIEGAEARRPGGIQSVAIGARVLFELANCGRPASLSDLARRLEMAPSNVRRYLVSLVASGLVEQDVLSLKYQLGVSSIRLGIFAMAQRPEIDLAVAECRALRDELDCCVGLLCPGESGPVMVHWLENADRVTHVGRIGASFSLIHSATGRAYLAQMPADMARAAFARETIGGLLPMEHGRKLDQGAFEDMLSRTRERGFSHVCGDYTPGIEAVGAVAFNAAGEVAFIMTVVGRIGLFDDHAKPRAPAALCAATRRLSALLGQSDARAPIVFPDRLRISQRDL